MTVPPEDVDLVREFCVAHSGGLTHAPRRIDFVLAADMITVFVRRAPPRPRDPGWIHDDVAQLRWSPTGERWSTYVRDRHQRWHRCGDVEPGPMDAQLRQMPNIPAFTAVAS